MPTNLGKVLVVGGAGYIGSHMVLTLQDAGYEPIVLDNLSKGHPEAVINAQLYVGEMGDKAFLSSIFSEHEFVGVMHFASFIEVGESVRLPGKYYRNNVADTLALLDVLTQYQTPNLIFSSSAAVYGEPQYAPIDENHPLNPINPYGRCKKMVEEIIKDYAHCSGMHYGFLRYFNASGADPLSRVGEHHEPESHLIPLLLQVAAGKRAAIKVYGRDYPTKDGTCIRDYVHVTDLCHAHLLALEKLMTGTEQLICNLGTGVGHSVQEVIDAAIEVTGKQISMMNDQRRAGDPAVLVAGAKHAMEMLNWSPRYTRLETIIEHAWKYQLRSQQFKKEFMHGIRD
jgi:UDP-glucose 4-epimerase